MKRKQENNLKKSSQEEKIKAEWMISERGRRKVSNNNKILILITMGIITLYAVNSGFHV